MPFPLAIPFAAKFAVPAAVKALPWKLIGIVAGAIVVIGLVWWGVAAIRDAGYEAGKLEVQTAWDKEKAVQVAAFAAEVAKRRQAEMEANIKIAQAAKEKKDAEVARAAAERRVAKLLRDRPSRPADGVPGANPAGATYQAGTFGTGAFLYREDGEFLLGEATRADTTREALIECYAWHDAVLEGLRQ